MAMASPPLRWMEYMQKKITDSASNVSSELLENLNKIINERMHPNLMNLLKALKDPIFFFLK
jgi:hypothetical protein